MLRSTLIAAIIGASLATSLVLAAPAIAQDGKATPNHVFSEAPADHTTGEADAPHTLIVYASNMCPHCGQWFSDEWPTVKSELVETGKLRVVFRPLPSNPVQLSMIGFMIAECAPEDDYFDVIEYQFARQGVIFDKMEAGGLREEFALMGKEAGLSDQDALNTCLASEDELASIHLAGDRAAAAKVSTIPGFILDGKLMEGDHTAKAIAQRLSGDAP